MVRNLAVLTVAVAIPLFSTALLQMSLAQITAASTEIVQGTVTGSYTALSGKTIFTHYKIQVAERWKGAANATTDVAIPGGSFNNLRQSFAGVPVLQTGQTYLLFLMAGSQRPEPAGGIEPGHFRD